MASVAEFGPVGVGVASLSPALCARGPPASSWNLPLTADAKEAKSQLPGGRRPGRGRAA